ncbi:MAG: sigma-70 family RNA polymerase sigma factor [Pedobacter sp.]|nr:MAG: sigma-70 family RNA polymerase sigma factor [Pedobacter sp.]
MKLPSDNSLVELLKKDNHGAYTTLVDRYWEDLYRHTWLKIKNTDDAKDIVQDIFLGIWKNRMTLMADERGSLAPYLFRAAKYNIINYFSRPSITIADEAALDLALNSFSDAQADDQILMKELQKFVDLEVEKLPERLKLPYRLSRDQELSIKEIALKLSVSEQTVKNNITSALNVIRFKIGKHNNSDTTVSFLLAVTCVLHFK